MLSAGPWGRAAAAGPWVEAGLLPVLGWNCSKIRFRPSSCEPGTAGGAEGDQRELSEEDPHCANLYGCKNGGGGEERVPG